MAVIDPGQGGRTARWAARGILVIGALFVVVGLSLLLLFGFNGPGLPATIWGLLLIVVYGFFEPDAVRGLVGQGAVQAGTRALVQVLLVLGALLLLNVFVRDKLADKQVDLTKNHVNSLAPQTETILHSLTKPVTATIWSQTSPSENQAAFDLLQRFHGQSALVTVHSYSLVDHPTLAQQQKIQAAGSVVMETAGQPSQITTDLTEQGFDTSLLRLSTGKSPKAYFLTGHGELDPKTPATNGASATLLGSALAKQGFTVPLLNLSAGAARPAASPAAAPTDTSTPSPAADLSPSPGDTATPAAAPSLPASPSPAQVAVTSVPADADELVILDARVDLRPDEIKAINTYLDHGGHLLVSSGPLVKTNVGEVTKRFGLGFAGGLVIDQQLQGNGQSAGLLQVTHYGNSVVARGLDGLPAAMIETAVSGTAAKNYTETPVVSSTASACVKDNITAATVTCGSGDKPGVQNLVVTVEQTGAPAGARPVRAILMGGATFASDVFAANQQSTPPANQPLMVNAMNWLAGQDKVINVPARTSATTTIFLTDAQKSLVTLGYPLLLPLLMLGLGVNAYLRRR